MKESKFPGAEVMTQLYVTERLTMEEVGERLGVRNIRTVQSWLAKAGIKPRARGGKVGRKMPGRPRKRPAVIPAATSCRPIERLTPEDQAKVRASVKDFFIYAEWKAAQRDRT